MAERALITGEWPKPVGTSTWDLTWCAVCKRFYPDEPVHEIADCVRFIRCRHCETMLDDGPDICEDCAWDIHDQLDGWTPDD